MIIEQLLLETRSSKKQQLECFNLSDGVFIEGTIPLDPESVLVTASKHHKEQTLMAMESCFMSISSKLQGLLAKAYHKDLLNQQFDTLVSVSNKTLEEKTDIHQVIDDLTTLLSESKRKGKSLFFYYFFNSINYLNAALNKASLQSNEKLALQDCARLLEKWRVFLADAKHTLGNQFVIIDNAEAFGDKRERFLLGNTHGKAQKPKYFTSQAKLVELVITDFSSTKQLGLELIANFEEVVDSIMQNDINSPLLIDVYEQTDLDLIRPILSKAILVGNFSQLANVGLVFHDYSILVLFSKQYPEICSIVCLLYCSPLLEMLNNSREIEEGIQDFIMPDEYWHILCARGQDLRLYSQIIIKPRFSEAGLKNAYLYKQDTDESGAQHNYITSTMQAQSVIYETNDIVKDSSRSVLNNEYEALSVAVINQSITTQLLALDWYMFKQYIALKKCSIENEPSALSIVDNLENRGKKMNRLPFDFELLGVWQKNDK